MSLPATRRRLLLHIGVAQAGQPSLAAIAASARVGLAANGVFTPSSLPGPAWDQAALATLRAELAASKAATVLLSDDTLCDRLTDTAAITRLRRQLLDVADEVTVLVYLCPQHQAQALAFQAAILAGDAGRAEQALNGHPWQLDYYARLLPWADAFGTAAMAVCPIEGDPLTAQITDLSRRLNLVAGTLPTPAAGPRLSPQALLFLANADEGAGAQSAVGRERADLINALMRAAPGELRLPGNRPAQLAHAFAGSNARVAQKYSCGVDGTLFTTPVPDALPTLAPSAQVVAVAANLWRDALVAGAVG